jgi:polysaccharide export outer membrane protein
VAVAACTCGTGCRVVDKTASHFHGLPVSSTAPRELHKAVLPDYRIEPPDILTIEGIHLIPKPPYRLRTFDTLVISVAGALPEAPISGQFTVEPGGFINIGPPYGSVKVSGMSVTEAKEAIDEHLRNILREPLISISLAGISAMQQITGEHLVAPDGKVTLGSYGTVSVVGMTVDEARSAIESHLSEFLEDPEIAVTVFAYNSKVYYVVTQGAHLGDQVFRFPLTGNETVLDAISQINGMDQVSSTKMWVARPGPSSDGCDQILPVDWRAISQNGRIDTNYQLLPGDRVYVAEDVLVALDNGLAKFYAPFERTFGFIILGTDTVSRLSGKVLRGGGLRRGENF